MIALIGKKVCEFYARSISVPLDLESDYCDEAWGPLAREIEEERRRSARERTVSSGLSNVLFLMEVDQTLEYVRSKLDEVLRRDTSLVDVFYTFYVKIGPRPGRKFFQLASLPIVQKNKLVVLWRRVGEAFLGIY
jgi:hypothetical protein